ncbi:anti-sigma factor [Sphingomonas sanguinis]|uniref:anti-sigma factor n=1 Tax=Sphingomonas sp. LC-1 TaxID=3110957 RepID=UPI0021BB76A5|nr:anti-sigma factor [Sphingomonas sp. LC-1]MCT8002085.1 anti-sigma factor [Sphingomonas sp. LC-1]
MTTDPDMMAGELVLGLLDGEERAAALRRILSDPHFAAEVEWWRNHFAHLFDDYRPADAPAHITAQIVAAPAAKPRTPIWATASAAVAIAAILLLFLLPRPEPVSLPLPEARSPNLMIAALAPEAKDAKPIGTTVNMDRGELRIAGNALAPEGKIAQLWVLREGKPYSLGLLNRDGATRIIVPTARRQDLRTGAVLAISIEPPGGSPEPTPTGPVVATGTLATT